MMKRLSIYWQIWKTIAAYSLAEVLISQGSSLLFLLGKVLRFGMSMLFLLLIQHNLTQFAGYTTSQIIVFFLTYQIIDTLAQTFFRGVYLFSDQVKQGELDFYLSKPLNPLFRALAGKPDILDAIFFIPTTLVSIWLILTLHIPITAASLALYLILLLNGLLIAAACHIFVLCLGILTTEVDNAILLYRDLSSLSRFPIDIYREPFRAALFFIVPIGFMNTIPAQVLLHVSPSYGIGLTFIVGMVFFCLSLVTWQLSLKKYTSAGG